MSTAIMSIVVSIAGTLINYILVLVYSFVLSLLSYLGVALLKPFDMTDDIFVTLVGPNLVATVEDIAIGAGIALSFLFFIFGLLRVFTGKLKGDVPNPFMLVLRFLVSVVLNYWIMAIIYDYIFPFADQFFDKAMSLSGTSSITQNISGAVEQMQPSWVSGTEDNVNSAMDIVGFAGTSAIEGISKLASTTLFLIFLVCILIYFLIATFKLAAENAERYFTVNFLVLTSPIVASTIVSEKSSEIFKNWCQLLLSNILTIIFNLIGFAMMVKVFNNVLATISVSGINIPMALCAFISLIAFVRMVQKFDQFLALITFKINPIKNDSIFKTLSSTIGGLKSFGFMTSGPLASIKELFSPDSKLSSFRDKAFEKVGAFSGSKNKLNGMVEDGNINENDLKTSKNEQSNVDYLNNKQAENKNFSDARKTDRTFDKDLKGERNRRNSEYVSHTLEPISPKDLQEQLGDVDLYSKDGIAKLNETFSDQLKDGQYEIYGADTDMDGNIVFEAGPKGGAIAGFGSDTLENIVNGNTDDSYFTASANIDPYTLLENDEYIAGGYKFYDKDHNKVFYKYFKTKDPEQANPFYHDISRTNANSIPEINAQTSKKPFEV